MIADLLDLFTDDVPVRTVTGRDRYGKPAHAAAVVLRGRVEYERRVLADETGRTVIEDGRVYAVGVVNGGQVALGVPALGDQAELTLPGGRVTHALSVERVVDEAGEEHVVIRFGTEAGR
ncbi:MAG: hypothetical protein ACOYY2_13095 [Actinomycetota bacterium]